MKKLFSSALIFTTLIASFQLPILNPPASAVLPDRPLGTYDAKQMFCQLDLEEIEIILQNLESHLKYNKNLTQEIKRKLTIVYDCLKCFLKEFMDMKKSYINPSDPKKNDDLVCLVLAKILKYTLEIFKGFSANGNNLTIKEGRVLKLLINAFGINLFSISMPLTAPQALKILSDKYNSDVLEGNQSNEEFVSSFTALFIQVIGLIYQYIHPNVFFQPVDKTKNISVFCVRSHKSLLDFNATKNSFHGQKSIVQKRLGDRCDTCNLLTEYPQRRQTSLLRPVMNKFVDLLQKPLSTSCSKEKIKERAQRFIQIFKESNNKNAGVSVVVPSEYVEEFANEIGKHNLDTKKIVVVTE